MNQRSSSTLVVAILHLVCAVLLLIIGAQSFSLGQQAGGVGSLLGLDAMTADVSRAFLLIGAIMLVAAIVEGVAAFGSVQIRGWSWKTAFYTAIVLGAAGLIVALLTLAKATLGFAALSLVLPFLGVGTLLVGLLHAFEVWLLLRRETQEAFDYATTGPQVIHHPTATETLPPPSYVTNAPRVVTAAPVVDAPVGSSARTHVMGDQAQVAAWLVQRSGGRGDPRRLRQSVNLIGRDSGRADVVIDESSVSGEHAKVRYESGAFVLYDLASTNGTFVNGKRVQKQRLFDGDTLRFGRAEFVFKMVSPKDH